MKVCPALQHALIVEDERMRGVIIDMGFKIPTPDKMLAKMTDAEIDALAGAWRAADGWRVTYEAAQVLRKHGLVDARTPHLSAYGTKVYHRLLYRRFHLGRGDCFQQSPARPPYPC